jgi:hypothetical protein
VHGHGQWSALRDHPLESDVTDDTNPPLGVLAPDNARTILVVAGDGDLSVALRDKVDRAYALIKDVRPEEFVEGFGTCLPWPWMVVGSSTQLSADAMELMRNRPILIFWRGSAPAGLPQHARSFERFGELADAVNTALTQRVAGMRLAIGLGVDLPDGDYARSAELQALVSMHPRPFDVPLDAFRSAARVLSTHRIALKPVRDAEAGTVSLVDAAGAAT